MPFPRRAGFVSVSLRGLAPALAYCAFFCASLQAVADGPITAKTAPTPPPDKSQYTLFNPTPKDQLREMEALYEGPYTVDAGHLQIEMYVFGYSHKVESSGSAETRSDFWAVAPVNIKLGLLNNLDAQFFMVPYSNLRIEDRSAGRVTQQSGLGDITLRTKWNLWGNDSGHSALALTPFVKLPTNQDHLGNSALEGGVIVPIALELPRNWWLGLAPDFDWMRNASSDGYHFEFASRNYLWHELIGPLSGYVEFDNRVSASSDRPWLGVLGIGLSFKATTNLQLDTGFMFGVTSAADDINIFFGTSYRF